MPDRTTKVTLTAVVSGYLAGMDQAQKKTAQFADGSAQKLAAQRQAMTTVGTAALAIGAAAAAGVALSIKAFADFDAKMSQVQTLSHATAEDMDKLRDSALHMGQAIGFSATQTADAEIELVKAGVSVSDMLNGALKGSLELAAAGQIDVGQATEIATIALTQFKLSGQDVPHVADLLAAGADKALGGVSDLGEALKSGGLVAAQFGVSLDETVGTLSAFANAGLLGETAGTTLRQALLKLSNPSVEASKTLKQLGISIYDSSGQFVGLAGLAGQLQEKMKDLDPATRNAALATIFGSRAIQGANVLYEEGAKGISKWTSEVNDTGFAAQQAAGKMDNLKGDVSKLGAAFNTSLIETGSTANDMLRGTVQTVTNLVAAFGDLPKPIQGGVLAVGAIVAVVGLAGGTALVAVPKIAAFKTAISDLGLTMKGISLAGGAVTLAITGIVTVLTLVANANAAAKTRADEFTNSLNENTGALTDNSRAVAVKQLTDSGAIKAARQLGLDLKLVTDATLGNADAIAYVNEKQAEFTAKKQDSIKTNGNLSSSLAEQYNNWTHLSTGIGQTTRAVKDGEQTWRDNAAAMGKNADKSKDAAGAYKSAADQAKDLANQVANLTDQINAANGVGQDAVTANASYRKALDDATSAVNDYVKAHGRSAKSLDESTALGSANAAMLADLAAKSEDAAKKQLALDGNTDNYQATLKAGHQAIVDRALALGATADQVQTLADKIAAVPTDKEFNIVANTTGAVQSIQDFINKYSGTTLSVKVLAQMGSVTAGRSGAFADGGFVPGTPSHSDNVLIAAASGEHVTRTAQAQIPENKRALEFINAGGVIRGFAGGGTVGFTPAPVYSSAPPRMYTPGPGPQQSAPSGPMTIEGTLDLGNGLTGLVKGVLKQETNRAYAAKLGR